MLLQSTGRLCPSQWAVWELALAEAAHSFALDWGGWLYKLASSSSPWWCKLHLTPPSKTSNKEINICNEDSAHRVLHIYCYMFRILSSSLMCHLCVYLNCHFSTYSNTLRKTVIYQLIWYCISFIIVCLLYKRSSNQPFFFELLKYLIVLFS